MEFFTGAKKVDWVTKTDVPLFLTYFVLSERKSLPRARGPWMLDPNGFENLRIHGCYPFDARTYATAARRYQLEIGGMVAASTCDWMCERAILKGGLFKGLRFKGTGLSVREHQARTIDSYIELMSLDDRVPWMPVLQAESVSDYWTHIAAYQKRGIDLSKASRVGVGSICRRQDTLSVVHFLAALLHNHGPVEVGKLFVHGFGVKIDGVAALVRLLRMMEDIQHVPGLAAELLRRFSSDSMAWSMGFRYADDPDDRPLKNRLEGALAWRADFLAPYEAQGLITAPAVPALAA